MVKPVKNDSNASQRRGRRMLLFMLMVFALPVIVVLAMYGLDWQPGGKSYGQLLAPPRGLQLAPLKTVQGAMFSPQQWKDKWSLVYLANTDCGTSCLRQLHQMRQVHASLGKELARVQRVLILSGGEDANAVNRIVAQYPDLIVLAGPQVAALSAQFAASGAAEDLFVVDPLGNLIMRYRADYEAKGLRKDMMRLLTYSWTG